LGVRATIVVDVHPGQERLIERVQRLNARALQLGEECRTDEAIERFDLAVALRAAFLREDQPVNAERGDELPPVMGAVDLAVLVVAGTHEPVLLQAATEDELESGQLTLE